MAELPERIAIFGFAFKANTSDTRESPAIRICDRLLGERAEVVVTEAILCAPARPDAVLAEAKRRRLPTA